MIVLYILLAALLVVLATSLVCFLKIFYSSRREKWPEYPVPAGEIYEPHHGKMIEWIKLARSLPHTDVSIRSFDGLKLSGTYYEFEKGAPIDILFHGYHGSAEQDLSGGVYRCQKLGHNVLIVDHRAAGKSEGHVITFGVNESRDAAARGSPATLHAIRYTNWEIGAAVRHPNRRRTLQPVLEDRP